MIHATTLKESQSRGFPFVVFTLNEKRMCPMVLIRLKVQKTKTLLAIINILLLSIFYTLPFFAVVFYLGEGLVKPPKTEPNIELNELGRQKTAVKTNMPLKKSFSVREGFEAHVS